jgi:hypothetical protein
MLQPLEKPVAAISRPTQAVCSRRRTSQRPVFERFFWLRFAACMQSPCNRHSHFNQFYRHRPLENFAPFVSVTSKSATSHSLRRKIAEELIFKAAFFPW